MLNLLSLNTALAFAVACTFESTKLQALPSVLVDSDWLTTICGMRRPITAPRLFSGFVPTVGALPSFAARSRCVSSTFATHSLTVSRTCSGTHAIFASVGGRLMYDFIFPSAWMESSTFGPVIQK